MPHNHWMQLTWQAGSSGIGTSRYTAYLPFTVEPGRDIGPLPVGAKFDFGDEIASIERSHDIYALSLSSFPDVSSARRGLDRLKGALLWMSLKYRVGIAYPKELTELKYFEQPVRVKQGSIYAELLKNVGWEVIDGHYNARAAVIVPEQKKLLREMGGRATVLAGIGFEPFVESFVEAAARPKLENIASTSRLKLAIELYAGSRFELSPNARFIGQVTALEALLPDESISTVGREALDLARSLVRQCRDQHARGCHEWMELESVLSRVSDLKRKSVGRSLREFIAAFVARHRQLGYDEELVRKAANMYEVRSTLVHGGFVAASDISDTLKFLDDLLPKLLSALFVEECQ